MEGDLQAFMVLPRISGRDRPVRKRRQAVPEDVEDRKIHRVPLLEPVRIADAPNAARLVEDHSHGVVGGRIEGEVVLPVEDLDGHPDPRRGQVDKYAVGAFLPDEEVELAVGLSAQSQALPQEALALGAHAAGQAVDQCRPDRGRKDELISLGRRGSGPRWMSPNRGGKERREKLPLILNIPPPAPAVSERVSTLCLDRGRGSQPFFL